MVGLWETYYGSVKWLVTFFTGSGMRNADAVYAQIRSWTQHRLNPLRDANRVHTPCRALFF